MLIGFAAGLEACHDGVELSECRLGRRSSQPNGAPTTAPARRATPARRGAAPPPAAGGPDANSSGGQITAIYYE